MYEVELYFGSAFTGDNNYFPLFDDIETAISAVLEKIGHDAVVDRMNARSGISANLVHLCIKNRR